MPGARPSWQFCSAMQWRLWEDVPQELRRELGFACVDTVEEALARAGEPVLVPALIEKATH